jgi:hypothetical protein
VIVDAMAKSVDLTEVLWEYEARVLLLEVSNDLVDSRRNLQKEWMVQELDKAVKWKLKSN